MDQSDVIYQDLKKKELAFFLPILALESLLGAIVGSVCVQLGFARQDQFPIFIILGMSGYFGAISKAPLTAIILVTEMVGDIRNLMPLFSVTFFYGNLRCQSTTKVEIGKTSKDFLENLFLLFGKVVKI